jgi:hypothetical protein
MSSYHSFSPKLAAGRLRAETKAKRREQLRREEDPIWQQLGLEHIIIPTGQARQSHQSRTEHRRAREYERAFGATREATLETRSAASPISASTMLGWNLSAIAG